MKWIKEFLSQALYCPMAGYKEIIVRTEDHITKRVLIGFFYRIKADVIRKLEPEEIPFTHGTPIIHFLVDENGKELKEAVISYLSNVNLNNEKLKLIDEIACEYLRKKNPEELKAAKEKTKKATLDFHIQQQMLGFEKKPEEIEWDKKMSKKCNERDYLSKIDGKRFFSFEKVKKLFSEILLFYIGEHLYNDKKIFENQKIRLEKDKGNVSIELSYKKIDSKDIYNIDINEISKYLLFVPGYKEPWIKKVILIITINNNDITETDLSIEFAEFIYNKIRLNKYSIISN